MSESKKFLLVDDFEFIEDDEPKTWTDMGLAFPFKKVSGSLNVTICGETHKYHTYGYTYCDYDKFIESLNEKDEKIANLESEVDNLREILSYGPRKISDIKDKDELEKECIGRFRRMWTYISELSEEEHHCVDKEEAIRTLYPNDVDDLLEHTYCYLCYYSDESGYGCDECPVKWDGWKKSCSGDSCFGKWLDATSIGDYSKASKYAAKIAALPLKEKKKGLILKDPTKDKFYGNVGEETLMKDMYGDVLHVGDVVEIRTPGHRSLQAVVNPSKDYAFIMGIQGVCRTDGSIDSEWSVKLVTSYKKLTVADKVCGFVVEEV